jgi:hypothetical protein
MQQAKQQSHIQTPDTLGGRLELAMKLRGIGVNDLNRMVRLRDGQPPGGGQISRLGKRLKPDAALVLSCAMTLRVNFEWLLLGEGPMDPTSGVRPAAIPLAVTPKPNLERALKANTRGRWSDFAIAAAWTLPEDLAVDTWISTLDLIETQLLSVLAPLVKRKKR